MATVAASPINFRQTGQKTPLTGIDQVLQTAVFDSYTFGLQWKNSPVSPNGQFPQYYKETKDGRIAVAASEVPAELRNKQFQPAINKKNYTSPSTGSWSNPGPAKGPYFTSLSDGSRVTYYWYRFIDQPSLQQYSKVWSESMKADLQSVIEKIQKNWTSEKDYMPAPRDGKALVAIDPALLVTPPKGFEIGYVPIVTAQEIVK